MTVGDWGVVLGGLLAIALVNWWFFLAGRSTVEAARTGPGVQEVTVVVRGGFQPNRIRAAAGAPLRLVFDRREEDSCSEEVVLPAFGIRRFLPSFSRTAIEITPRESGQFEFTCGMGMLRGMLDVTAPGSRDDGTR